MAFLNEYNTYWYDIFDIPNTTLTDVVTLVGGRNEVRLGNKWAQIFVIVVFQKKKKNCESEHAFVNKNVLSLTVIRTSV